MQQIREPKVPEVPQLPWIMATIVHGIVAMNQTDRIARDKIYSVQIGLGPQGLCITCGSNDPMEPDGFSIVQNTLRPWWAIWSRAQVESIYTEIDAEEFRALWNAMAKTQGRTFVLYRIRDDDSGPESLPIHGMIALDSVKL